MRQQADWNGFTSAGHFMAPDPTAPRPCASPAGSPFSSSIMNSDFIGLGQDPPARAKVGVKARALTRPRPLAGGSIFVSAPCRNSSKEKNHHCGEGREVALNLWDSRCRAEPTFLVGGQRPFLAQPSLRTHYTPINHCLRVGLLVLRSMMNPIPNGRSDCFESAWWPETAGRERGATHSPTRGGSCRPYSWGRWRGECLGPS